MKRTPDFYSEEIDVPVKIRNRHRYKDKVKTTKKAYKATLRKEERQVCRPQK